MLHLLAPAGYPISTPNQRGGWNPYSVVRVALSLLAEYISRNFPDVAPDPSPMTLDLTEQIAVDHRISIVGVFRECVKASDVAGAELLGGAPLRTDCPVALVCSGPG